MVSVKVPFRFLYMRAVSMAAFAAFTQNGQAFALAFSETKPGDRGRGRQKTKGEPRIFSGTYHVGAHFMIGGLRSAHPAAGLLHGAPYQLAVNDFLKKRLVIEADLIGTGNFFNPRQTFRISHRRDTQSALN